MEDRVGDVRGTINAPAITVEEQVEDKENRVIFGEVWRPWLLRWWNTEVDLVCDLVSAATARFPR